MAASSAIASPVGRLFKARTFETYPQGAARWTVLLLTVVAQLIVYYEFQLGPILPLLLPYLHMSHVAYGNLLATILILSTLACFYGGPLADRYGRVVVIRTCLTVMIALNLLNLTITNIPVFIVIRTAMGLVGGLIVPSLFSLARDMTPRTSRAMGISLIVIGAISANWLSNFIAGVTLPIFHTWQSQIWLLSIFALAMYLPIVLGLRDLSPQLRLQIHEDERTTLEAKIRARGDVEVPRTTLAAYRALLAHHEVLLLNLSVILYATTLFLFQNFGGLLFTEVFSYTPAMAARMVTYIWTANILAMFAAAYLSDLIRNRKVLIQIGAFSVALLLFWWVRTLGHPVPYQTTRLVCIAIGVLFGTGFITFQAYYSEVVEDVSPALQATGWSVYHSFARGWNALSSALIMFISVHWGWNIPILACAVGGVLVGSVVTLMSGSEPAPKAQAALAVKA